MIKDIVRNVYIELLIFNMKFIRINNFECYVNVIFKNYNKQLICRSFSLDNKFDRFYYNYAIFKSINIDGL